MPVEIFFVDIYLKERERERERAKGRKRFNGPFATATQNYDHT